MSLTNSSKFIEWKDVINGILTNIGTSLASMPNANNISDSINTLKNRIGVLGDLNTTAKTDIVVAANEINTKIGSLSSLNTTIKTSIIAAINEVFARVSNGTVVKYTQSFATTDWVTGQITIDAATHGNGETKYLNVMVYEGSTSPYTNANVKVTVSDIGTVIIEQESGDFDGFLVIM